MKLNIDDIIVYTALIGNHEGLNDQPQIKKSNLRHVCFTDDFNLKSDTWEIIIVEPIFPQDPQRSQRHLKIRPHLLFPDYKYSFYFDNSIILKTKTEDFIEMITNQLDLLDNSPLCSLPNHSFRESLIAEFNQCSLLKLDNEIRIYDQLNDYLRTDVNYFKKKPYWGGIIFRSHNHKDLIRFSEIWFAHVCRYSKRDQLSIIHSAHQANLKISGFVLNNSSSKYHKWPVKINRLRHKKNYDELIDLIPYNLLNKLDDKIKRNNLILRKIEIIKNQNKFLLILHLIKKITNKFKGVFLRLFRI